MKKISSLPTKISRNLPLYFRSRHFYNHRLFLPIDQIAFFFIQSDPQQDDRFAQVVIGQIVAFGADLVEGDLGGGHFEFEDIDFLRKFQHGVNAPQVGERFGVDRKAQ